MPPPLRSDQALFLDLDGTIIDLAPTPESVQVAPGLPETLRQTQSMLGGALALVSGRKLADIDRLLGPGFPCAAEHGAVLRDANGTIIQNAKRLAEYDRWLNYLRQEISEMPGVLIEEKAYGLVVHYRQAPEYEPVLSRLVDQMVGESPDATLLLAHCAFELKPRGYDKGEALAWFMQKAPFLERVPVYIGDDITDEPAIRKAGELGGIGLHVARDFSGSTQAVRDWIKL
jgi:trehalose 6-phosphate phosphatase